MKFEELKERLAELGATKAQLESKILMQAMCVLAGEDVSIVDWLQAQKDEVEARIREAMRLEKQAQQEIGNLTRERKATEALKTFYDNEWEKLNQEKADFEARLKDMETPEARDRVRATEFFLKIAQRTKLPINNDNLQIVGDILSAKDVI